MKRTLRMIRTTLALVTLAVGLGTSHAAELESAQLTEIVKDVNLLLGSGGTRPASLSSLAMNSRTCSASFQGFLLTTPPSW